MGLGEGSGASSSVKPSGDDAMEYLPPWEGTGPALTMKWRSVIDMLSFTTLHKSIDKRTQELQSGKLKT